MNELLFFLGFCAALAGGTIAVNGFLGRLHLRLAFGNLTGLGGVLIQILGAIMIALSEV